MLTGKYGQGASSGATSSSRYNVRGGINTQDVAKADALRPICTELGCSLPHLSLAWALANPNISTLITGATSTQQALENVKCMEVLPKLTPSLLARIEELVGTKPTPAPSHRARV